MHPGKRVKLVIMYEWLDREVPIAEVWDEEVLSRATGSALKTAEAKLEMVRNLDPVLRIEEEFNLRKLRRLFDLLVSRQNHG